MQPVYLCRLLTRTPLEPGLEPAGVLTVIPPGGDPAPLGDSLELPAKGAPPAEVEAWVERELVPRLAARRAAGDALWLDVNNFVGRIAVLLARSVPGGIDRLIDPALREPASHPGEPALPAELKASLRELARQACWKGPEHPEVRATARRLTEVHADFVDAIDEAVACGGKQRVALEDWRATLRTLDPDSEDTEALAANLAAEYPEIGPSIRKALEFARGARRRRVDARSRCGRGEALSRVRPGPSNHRIDLLAPAPAYTLLIDETGEGFHTDDASARRDGRLVGLLVPDGVALPPLPPEAHAAMDSLDDHDERVQAVLDAPVGVLGIGTGALVGIAGDLWTAGVAELISWVARLLPIEGETRLDVVIEARGDVGDAGCEWLRAGLARSLAEEDPGRYARLRLSVAPVRKGAHPLLAYADALAFTWGSQSEHARARLRQSGLHGTCLIEGDAAALRGLREATRGGASLDEGSWRALVTHPEAELDGSLVASLLARLGERCRTDPGAWQRYLEATRQHLDGKAVRLSVLGREVAWLDRHRPEQARVGARLRLAWLVARLEARNHTGALDDELLDELRSLCDRLFTEDPVLVCQAELDVAVLATNRFDVDAATAALGRFCDRPPEVPGLRHWCRVQSSLGQHAAFRGCFAIAEAHFARALDGFERLSDPDEAAGEIAQTATYRAIAAIDDPEAALADVRERVARVVPLDADAIYRLAGSADPREKYRHHLLLRYLAHRGGPDERAAYLAARDRWTVDAEGHPWPLIEAYRGLLLAETYRVAALEHLETARSLAFRAEQGPTVLLIGAAIAVAATALGGEAAVGDDELVALAGLLPRAAPRIEKLREALERPREPLALLRDVLPFSFR